MSALNHLVIIAPVSLTSSWVALPIFSSSPVRLSACDESGRTHKLSCGGACRFSRTREADPRVNSERVLRPSITNTQPTLGISRTRVRSPCYVELMESRAVFTASL